MTDLATALVDTSELGEFEGQDILRTTVKITGAGDGLSKAMAIEPRVLRHHTKVYVVLETEVVDVQFPPIKDTDCVVRKHVLRANTCTIVEGSLVKEVLDAQAERIQLAKEAAAGIQRLPEYDGEEDGAGDDPMYQDAEE